MARAAAKKVKPRKRLTGDERRESILEAALGCFLEKGYIATTINDIRDRGAAKRAGVERLATRCRIERGLIEGDFGASLRGVHGDDGRVEGSAIGFGVIDAMGHERVTIGSSK